MVPTLTLPAPSDTPLGHLVDLAEDAHDHGSPSAFQAMLATALCAVRRALDSETEARAAALSLAQHERLDAMTDELRTWQAALEGVLNTQGRCLLDATAPAAPARSRLRLWNRSAKQAPAPPRSWSVAVGVLLDVLDTQAHNLSALATGQPDGAPSRLLGDDLAAVLERHRDALRAEAQRWAA